mgnify:FL=1
MFSRFLIAVAAAAVVLGGSVCAKAAEVLNFGIISTESSQNLKQLWDPFLADMEKATGFKVKAFFASDYAGIIEGMRFKKVDLCWIGNKGAIQMVDRSDGSVFAQTTAADGTDGYYSLLVVNKESPLKSVDDVLKNAAGLRFSNGDPNSTSGFLVPGYYVFAKNNVDPKKIFKNVVAANHESNALAVANRQVDVATCNNEAIGRLEIAHPEKAAQIREIWRSPLIPSDPLVWRNSLPESTKKKIADFIFGYGVKGDVAHAKAILEKLPEGAVVRSPGMKYKHYAPKADVTLLEGTFEQFKAYVDAHADQNPSCLCFTGEAEKLGWPCVEYGREGDGADQAKHIFRSLRALDEQGDGVVYARCPKKDGLSMAVYNRLIRAAAFRVIQL